MSTRIRVVTVAAGLVGALALGACTSDPASTASTAGAAGSAATASTTAGAAAPAPTPAPAYAQQLATGITEELKTDGVSGAVVLVRSAKGDWTSAFGTRTTGGGDPVTTSDVFRLGDLTHTMTASVVLLLQQQGRLAMTDPIAKYVDGVPNGDRITIADLGTNNSGLANYTEDPVFAQAYAADPKRTWTPPELLQIAYAHPLEKPDLPDAWVNYSNTDYLLLGMVVEKVTGKPVAQAVKELVTGPLQLGSMGLAEGAGALPDPHPHGYVFAASPFGDPVLPPDQRAAVKAGQQQPTDRSADSMSWAGTAGGLYANAADTATFFQSMIDGPWLNDETRAARVARLQGIGITDPKDVTYGFGVAKYGQYYLYSGGTPGYNAVVAYDPVAKTTIVALANLMWESSGGAPVQGLFARITDAVDPVVLPQ